MLDPAKLRFYTERYEKENEYLQLQEKFVPIPRTEPLTGKFYAKHDAIPASAEVRREYVDLIEKRFVAVPKDLYPDGPRTVNMEYEKPRDSRPGITCPGVWLCPNGKVTLRITSLGSALESHRVSPIFPLLFHNEFNFKKTFTRLAALTELQRNLEQEFLYAELIQWLGASNQAIVLATFETNLADVLYPVPRYKGLMPGVDVDLLMDPSKYFPGIIAPKIEISTKTVIEEVSNVRDANVDGSYVVNPRTINSKRTCVHRKRPVNGIIRQRRVCHGRTKPRVQICRAARHHRCETSNRQPPIDEHCRPTRETIPPRVSAICGNAHLFDSCPVCFEYKCYFSCECGDPSAIDARKRISDPIESFESSVVENENNDDHDDGRRCCACGVPDASIVPQQSISGAQPRIQCLRKKEQFGKDRGENISECDACHARGRTEARQNFYKNLERFYKRMYKQAKLRAREATERS